MNTEERHDTSDDNVKEERKERKTSIHLVPLHSHSQNCAQNGVEREADRNSDLRQMAGQRDEGSESRLFVDQLRENSQKEKENEKETEEKEKKK